MLVEVLFTARTVWGGALGTRLRKIENKHKTIWCLSFEQHEQHSFGFVIWSSIHRVWGWGESWGGEAKKEVWWCLTCVWSLRSCPLPINPLCLSREEGMIHLFVGSHVKKPESGLFSDWIGNNTNDLHRSDWPKCRHPLVVIDFSLHFCLRNEQSIHTRARYEISAGSVFLNLKNA